MNPLLSNILDLSHDGTSAPRYNNNSNGDSAEASCDADKDVAFVPPVDVFDTETAYVLHVALPGAKKEHIGVNWDQDKSTLNIAGVTHRPGDEAFLQALTSPERKIGVFERKVVLPPSSGAGSPPSAEKAEIDHLAISAKMEDGLLIVTVPKVEKEWTEIRSVDIE